MSRFPIQMVKQIRGALPALVGVAAAAAALGAYAAVSVHSKRVRPFGLSARPAHRWIAPGATARYRIVIRRHRFTGRVRLRLHGAVARARTRLAFVRHSRSRAVLTIRTSFATSPGNYHLRLTGSHGHLKAALRLALRVDPPQTAALTLAGNATEPLKLGVPEPLDLTLGNPNKRPILVKAMTVGLQRLVAPRARPAHPCSLDDFAVQQFSGGYPLTVPGLSNRRLSDLGIASSEWPQITIINRPQNQDGCQGATVTLAYTGTARTG